MTNYENAVTLLQTATTVQQWNELRDSIKNTLTVAELAQIDSSITKVLGQD